MLVGDPLKVHREELPTKDMPQHYLLPVCDLLAEVDSELVVVVFRLFTQGHLVLFKLSLDLLYLLIKPVYLIELLVSSADPAPTLS